MQPRDNAAQLTPSCTARPSCSGWLSQPAGWMAGRPGRRLTRPANGED